MRARSKVLRHATCFSLLSCGIAVLFASPVDAYQSPAHIYITIRAIDEATSGSQGYDELNLYSSSIVNGSWELDGTDFIRLGDGFNYSHFTNSINGQIPSAIDEATKNPDWLSRAIGHYRSGQVDLAYFEAGYVAHLLEDMGSPPHVFGVPHGPLDGFEFGTTFWGFIPYLLSSPQVTVQNHSSVTQYFSSLATITQNALPDVYARHYQSGTPGAYLDNNDMSFSDLNQIQGAVLPQTIGHTAGFLRFFHDVVHTTGTA